MEDTGAADMSTDEDDFQILKRIKFKFNPF